MRRVVLALLLCLGGWFATGSAFVFAAEPEHADIRVLIDISGSMKQNDPRNLRRPALRMLVGLMQPGTRAGVWTFAQYAAELVQPGDVDEAWKQRALDASEKINSPGLFTNIELVMERAIRDWQGAPVRQRRNLLLLTDGVVDVSKDAAENAASRNRILEDLLPRIRAMDAKVHTVALSSRADHALLEKLARETGGWYQQVETADELQRVFLKLFEQAGKPAGVPLKDNKFRVDNTIREATVLVFRPDDGADPELTAPSGGSFTRQTAPPNVTWHSDTGYELITIRDPEAGEWALKAEVDPDNRVMVVTDLKLRVSELPARIAVGDLLPVSAHLTNNGHLIDRAAFLDLVEMRAETLTDIGLAPQPLNDKGQKGDATAGDGRYGMNLVERRAHPEMDLVIAAESSTFLREHRHLLAVLEPAVVRVVVAGDEARVEVTVDEAVMRAADVTVSVWQQADDGSRRELQLVREGETGYRAPLLQADQPVYARVQGVSRLGNPITREYGPVYAPGAGPVPSKPQPAAEPDPEPVAVEPSPRPDPADAPQQPRAAEPAPEPEPETAGWVMPTLVFGGVNLLLLVGGLLWWLIRRRKRGAGEAVVLDEDVDDDDGDADPTGDTAQPEVAEKS